MNLIFERRINYYETDKMGVVHHSNYIRYLEEARCYFLDKIEIPYLDFENNNIMIPVLEVNVIHKQHVTFDDVLVINVVIKDFSGVRMTISYNVTDKKTGNTVILAETKHCFTNMNLKPINLKKTKPDFAQKFTDLKLSNQ